MTTLYKPASRGRNNLVSNALSKVLSERQAQAGPHATSLATYAAQPCLMLTRHKAPEALGIFPHLAYLSFLLSKPPGGTSSWACAAPEELRWRLRSSMGLEDVRRCAASGRSASFATTTLPCEPCPPSSLQPPAALERGALDTAALDR